MNFQEAKKIASKIIGAKIKRASDGSFQVISLSGKVIIADTNNAVAETQKGSVTETVKDVKNVPKEDGTRYCVDCSRVIPTARLNLNPSASRCIKCQTSFEKTHDTRAHINEGLAGTRSDNIRMRYRGGS
jgi:hypothetical protein